MEGKDQTVLLNDNIFLYNKIRNTNIWSTSSFKFNITKNYVFTNTHFSQKSYYSTKILGERWESSNSILSFLIACYLSKMPINYLSRSSSNYVTIKHSNIKVINIITNHYSYILHNYDIINLRNKLYYIKSKPLLEISKLYCSQQTGSTSKHTTNSQIPKNSKINITNFFNNESLAFWFLFCGKFSNLDKSYMFNVNFLTKEDLTFVKTVIENNCNIKTYIKQHKTINNTYHYLYISKEHINEFECLVNSYYSLKEFLCSTPVIYPPGCEQYSMLIGLLLGDGNIRLGTGNNGAARYSHTSKHLEVIIALSEVWLPLYFTKTGKNTPWPRNNPTQWWRSSKTLPELYDIYCLWYKKHNDKAIKIIPYGTLKEYFTSVSLAFWFMDDGYYDNTNKTFYFCTDSFSYEECQFLVNLLFTKFNIKASVVIRRRDSMWRIRVFRQSVPLFRELVTPYILPVFKYKLAIE